MAPLSFTASAPFLPGDPAPNFEAPSSSNPRYSFQTAAGRYLVLCFLGTLADERSRRTLQRVLARSRARFDDIFASFFGVTIDPEDERQGRARPALPGVRWFWDFQGVVSRLYGGGEGPLEPAEAARGGFTLVIDPFLRVVANLPFEEPETHAARLEALLQALPPPSAHAGVEIPAPVLVLPRVFEPELCAALIRLYDERGGSATGFMRERGGKTVAVLDNSFKRRRDFNFDEDAEPALGELRREVRARLVRRLLPAIRKTFQFAATRIERYIVACYDAETGGYFRPHRDDTTLATAHRRFAVTLNLNAEDYEGGDLRFPEFGDRTYRAPTGGAVVFSCSLLHEAAPVTRGRRYACLPFLYDEAAGEVRRRNRAFLSDQVIDQNAPQGAAAPSVAAGANSP